MIKKVLAFMFAVVFTAAAVFIPAVPTSAFSGDDRIVIVLDPGHGGHDPGAADHGLVEKDCNLKIATALRDELSKNPSFIVYMTRTGDSFLDLHERGMYANTVNADILISIHVDSSTSTTASGTTSFCSVIPECAMTALGSAITRSISSATGIDDNGVVQRYDNAGYYWNPKFCWDAKDRSLGQLSDYYSVPTWCAKFGISSMIMEHGYLSSSKDASYLASANGILSVAKAEASAIIAYYTNHSHTYGEREVDYPSTCAFQGKSSEHCTVCGHRRNITDLPAAPDNHYWTDEIITPASCGVDGTVKRTCVISENLISKGYSIASHTKTDKIPAPSDHDYKLVETVDATHTVDGYKKYVCSICNSSFKDVIPAEGHSYKFIKRVEQSCTTGGGNLYRCSVCGDEYTAGLIPPLGHDFGDSAEKKEATCTEDGYFKGTCTRCKEVVNETYPALGHDYGEPVILDATCTEDGSENTTCKRCGETETKVIPATGHDMEISYGFAATCEAEGSELYVCTVCGAQDRKTTPALGHDWVRETIEEASFFSSGSERLFCRNGCGEEKIETLKAGILKPLSLAIISAFVVVVAGGVTAVILIKKKKAARAVSPAEKDEEKEDKVSENQLQK